MSGPHKDETALDAGEARAADVLERLSRLNAWTDGLKRLPHPTLDAGRRLWVLAHDADSVCRILFYDDLSLQPAYPTSDFGPQDVVVTYDCSPRDMHAALREAREQASARFKKG